MLAVGSDRGDSVSKWHLGSWVTAHCLGKYDVRMDQSAAGELSAAWHKAQHPVS